MMQGTKEEREFMLNRLIVKAIALSVMVIFLLLTTCTIHMNSYNPEEAKAEMEKAKAEISISQQAHLENMERLKTLNILIKEQNVDPIAARCAVEGWDNQTSDVCLAIANDPFRDEKK